jgi:hypothetical protein
MVKGGYTMKLESVKSLLSLPKFMSFVIYENVAMLPAATSCTVVRKIAFTCPMAHPHNAK